MYIKESGMENNKKLKPFLLQKSYLCQRKNESGRVTKILTRDNGTNYINHGNTFIDVHLSPPYEYWKTALYIPTLHKFCFSTHKYCQTKQNHNCRQKQIHGMWSGSLQVMEEKNVIPVNCTKFCGLIQKSKFIFKFFCSQMILTVSLSNKISIKQDQ